MSGGACCQHSLFLLDTFMRPYAAFHHFNLYNRVASPLPPPGTTISVCRTSPKSGGVSLHSHYTAT